MIRKRKNNRTSNTARSEGSNSSEQQRSSFLPVLLIVALVVLWAIWTSQSKHTNTVVNSEHKASPPTESDSYLLLETREGVFGRLSVVEKEKELRFLLCGRIILGGIFFDDGLTSTFAGECSCCCPSHYSKHSQYKAALLTLFLIQRQHCRCTLIFLNYCILKECRGLGVGIVARDLYDGFKIKVDVVEIDGNVVELAKKYFYYVPSGSVYIEDARHFLFREDNTNRYDLIVHDVFSGGVSAAPELITREAFERVKLLLTERGVVAFNCLTYIDGPKSVALYAVLNTIRSVFNHVRIFKGGNEFHFSNLVIFASDHPIHFDLPIEYLSSVQLNEMDVNWVKLHLLDFEFFPEEDDKSNTIITDANFESLSFLYEDVGAVVHQKVKEFVPARFWNQ